MKTTEYNLEIVRGHILIPDDRGSKVLVDTGSPLSFHKDGIIALGGVVGMEIFGRTPVVIVGGEVRV